MAGKPGARRKADVSKMSPEEKAEYEARLEKQRAPRPAYIVYEGEAITVKEVTRDSDAVLAAVAGNPNTKYVRIMIK